MLQRAHTELLGLPLAAGPVLNTVDGLPSGSGPFRPMSGDRAQQEQSGAPLPGLAFTY